VGLVDRLLADLVDPIEDVEQVPLRVDADLLDCRDDLADDLLARPALGRSRSPRR